MTGSRRFGLLVAMASALLVGADDPKTKPTTEPEAKARLDALVAAYRALPAYSDHGETTVVVKVGEREVRQVHKAETAFVRPNKVSVRTDLVRVVSDGSTLTSVVDPLKTYQSTPAPKKLAETALRSGPLGAFEFGGASGRPLVHILNLVLGDDPARLIEDFAPRLLVEPDREVDGVAYKVLRLDEADNDDWRFLIDPKTGLIAIIEIVVEGDAAKSSIAGADVHVDSIRWAAGAISTDPLGDDAFAFKPPDGYKAVEKLQK